MARKVHEREDLLRDATALVPRIQLRLSRHDSPLEVFAGFREQALSLYFGEDPVYHFNPAGKLRRAFVDEQLIKAEKGKLIAWSPDRNDKRTDMLRHDLTAEEQEHFCERMMEWLSWLQSELKENRYRLLGQVPQDGDTLERLQKWLGAFETISIASSPRVSS